MTSTLRLWLHRLALLTAACTCFLVFAGGMVTSTGSGLAVPDWPLSYGTLFPPMVGGIFYEHGHRMVAALVALLTAALAAATWRIDARPWVRRLAVLALAAILAQALLGGLTVLFLLPVAISVAHAGVANLFFCLLVSLAVFTTPEHTASPHRPVPAREASLFPRWSLLTAAIYVQILIGALMRHTGSGLAIPDFPLAFGHLLPPLRSWPVAINFAHRIGALGVLILASRAMVRTLACASRPPGITLPAWLVTLLLPVQILLGALTIWTGKAPILASLHVAVGTLTLGVSLWAALRARPAIPQRNPLHATLALGRSAAPGEPA
ncbi:MAG: heme A synthase [Acidobacteriota bacterium]